MMAYHAILLYYYFTILFVQSENLPETKMLNFLNQLIPTKPSTIPRGYIDGALCNRQCDGKIKRCFFNFNVETFYSMSKACFDCPNNITDCYRPDCIIAGGIKRTVSVVNRKLPGPAIEVCQGDKIMVHVENNLIDGASTTIHWHGQHMVKDKYMDGVPWISQCPILYNNNFTYTFTAVNYGTMWWHSHSEMQRGDGVYGPMIIRQSKKNNHHVKLYDFDRSSHVMMITDWTHRPNLEVFESFILGGEKIKIPGLLVNGLGYQSNTNITKTPLANFTVKSGFRYRFRVVQVAFYDCPIEISIDQHKMTIISTDSEDLEPFQVDSFVATSGERFDFILKADQPNSTYYIRFKGYLQCSHLETFTMALLHYEGSLDVAPNSTFPTYATSAPTGGVIYNPVSITNATGYANVIGIHESRSIHKVDSSLNSSKIHKFYVSLDMSSIDHPLKHRYPYYGFKQVDENYQSRTPQLNHITYTHEYDVPLLQGRFEINQKAFCNEKTLRNSSCETNFCQCPHIYTVSKNAIVEFVFMELWDQDHAATLHQLHLHGYTFAVLGWGELGRNLTRKQVINLDKEGQLKRNFVKPPLKDTVSVPKGGYTIIRFKATNVGYWLLHCHIDIHSAEGMQLVIKVGTDRQMPSPPKNFPKCSNWPKK